MKEFYALFLALLMSSVAMTQTDDPCESCLPDGIIFETQAQIDSFQIKYPNCNNIEGDVIIGSYEGSDITNLSGLSTLTLINGNLSIGLGFGNEGLWNPLLTSLTGLDNLVSIGGNLNVEGNSLLSSLTGLDNLTSIGGHLQIGRVWFPNPALTSLTGLENLYSIGEDLSIGYNDSLSSLSGLESLISLGGGLNISLNGSLSSLSGIEGLTTIGGGLTIFWNINLSNLTGLDNLTSIGGDLNIDMSIPLSSLTGLGNLTYINGDMEISNTSLETLSALNNINSINGNLKIKSNASLTNITGIDNIDPELISLLHITGNHLLATCEAECICNYLEGGGTAEIWDNDTGCNSPEEVQDSCEAHAGIIDGLSLADGLLIYPNPAHATITIELLSQPSKNTTLTISNTNGQQLITQSITEPQTEIDISHLPTGIYVVKVWNDKEVMVRKVVKR